MLIPNILPASLARSEHAAALFTRQGVAYNYAIAAQPFLSAASVEDPILRETAPMQKDQIDDQLLPGEQTLGFWWLRSQQSFHGGAGQTFADPTQDNPFNQIRFRASRNIDPWTQGEVKMLHEAKPMSPTLPGVKDATEFNFRDGDPAAFAVTDTQFAVIRADTVDVESFTATTEDVHSVTTDGTNMYVAAKDGLWSAPIPATYSANLGTDWVWTKLYDFGTNDKHVFINWVKSRLVAGVGPAVYELERDPTSPPASLPTAAFENNDPEWVWTGITESANAILIAGNALGVRGSVLKLILDDNGELPVLSAATIAAQLPFGEVPYSLVGYLGRFVAIGTNQGARIGVVDPQGNIEYGPLLFESDAPIKAWAARDRFLWCSVSRGIDGHSGLYRIDLGLELGTLRFPYATDLVADGDESDCGCAAIATIGHTGRLFFATANNAYVESDDLAPEGYLQTSRVRYNTVEPKLFKLVRLRGPVLEAPLVVTTLDQQDNVATSHLLPQNIAPGDSDITLLSPSQPIDFMSLRFEFTRSDVDETIGPMLWAYQLKALPATPRQRLIQIPVLVFDWETDRNGQKHGGEGTARRRLQALERAERASETVMFQDFDVNEATEVTLERVTFRQTSPPAAHEGWGGVATVLMRTVR